MPGVTRKGKSIKKKNLEKWRLDIVERVLAER